MYYRKMHWGQTPWDKLAPEELLPLRDKLRSAGAAVYLALTDLQKMLHKEPYWSKEGVGGKGIAFGDWILRDSPSEWAHTPERLLLGVWRSYWALRCSHGVLEDTVMLCNLEHPFFQEEGVGRRGLFQGRDTLALAEAHYRRESIYNVFFCYAEDLFFWKELGGTWAICDTCHSLASPGDHGRGPGKPSPNDGKPCKEILPTSCPGTMRQITWEDLCREGAGGPWQKAKALKMEKEAIW